MARKNRTAEHRTLLRDIAGAARAAEIASREAAETKAKLEALIARAVGLGIQKSTLREAVGAKTRQTIYDMISRATKAS
jgi:hypothetical protein